MRTPLAVMILAGTGSSAVGAETRNVAVLLYPGATAGSGARATRAVNAATVFG